MTITRGPEGVGSGPEGGEVDHLEVVAPAKVNLFLRVLAREEGGYHQLETLFQTLEFGDGIEMWRTEAPGVELEVTGPEAEDLGPPESNLAVRAARAVLEALDAREGGRPEGGVRIRLDKRVPHGAGLGGGSSDAATVLRAVNRLFSGGLQARDLLKLAAGLGSDVPVFLSPSPTTLAWGRGDRLLPLPPLPQASVVLAFPQVRIATPEAFRLLAEWGKRSGGGVGDGWPGRGARGAALLEPGSLAGWGGVAAAGENDFHVPIFQAWPELGTLCEGIEAAGAGMALLSGSGSTLFGIFPTQASGESAVTVLKERFPGVRFLLTRTRGVPTAPKVDTTAASP